MKTMFAISRGVFAPESFRWIAPPELLLIGDLWDAVRSSPPGLLMRVHTNAQPGASLQEGDTVESVIGIIDSTSRWRASLALVRGHLAAIRNSNVQQACWASYSMLMQKHPAAIMQPERQAAVDAIRNAVESLPKELMQSVFESQIAAGLARFIMADNDVEAAQAVPFERSMMLGIREVGGSPRMDAREATIDVLASGVLLTEAHARLAERAPEWLFVPMPAVSFSEGPATRGAAAPPEADEDQDDEDDEG